MKLALFDDFRPGVITADGIVDISDAVADINGCGAQALMEALIANWEDYRPKLRAFVAGGDARPLESVRLRQPLPRPSKILCAAANYKEGIEGNISDLEFFHKSPSAIIGDGEAMVLPDVDLTIVHHELELGVVIGKTCSNVPIDEAMDYVFGYTIVQDGSARGRLLNGKISFFTQKNWDTFAPIGPAITTADEIADPHDLQVRLWANGELRQDYNTSDMAHRIPTLIAEASTYNTLVPGDIIATGCNRQGLGPMQDGDEVVQQITGLGVLRTRVSDPRKRRWPAGIDIEFADFVTKPREKRGAIGAPRMVPASQRVKQEPVPA